MSSEKDTEEFSTTWICHRLLNGAHVWSTIPDEEELLRSKGFIKCEIEVQTNSGRWKRFDANQYAPGTRIVIGFSLTPPSAAAVELSSAFDRLVAAMDQALCMDKPLNPLDNKTDKENQDDSKA